MALDGADWGKLISDNIIAANPDLSGAEQTELENAWKLVCNTHTIYIAGNAIVNTAVIAQFAAPADVTGAGIGAIT